MKNLTDALLLQLLSELFNGFGAASSTALCTFVLILKTLLEAWHLLSKGQCKSKNIHLNEKIRYFFVGIDDGEDLDPEMLTGIYERVRACEFQPSADHVLQVMKVEQTIVGKKPVSASQSSWMYVAWI